MSLSSAVTGRGSWRGPLQVGGIVYAVGVGSPELDQAGDERRVRRTVVATLSAGTECPHSARQTSLPCWSGSKACVFSSLPQKRTRCGSTIRRTRASVHDAWLTGPTDRGKGLRWPGGRPARHGMVHAAFATTTHACTVCSTRRRPVDVARSAPGGLRRAGAVPGALLIRRRGRGPWPRHRPRGRACATSPSADWRRPPRRPPTS